MMKKWSLAVLMVCALLFATVFTGVPTNANAEVLFEENFEGYAVGSFPSDKLFATWGGWWVTEEGGNKFLRSTSTDFANYHMYTLQEFPGNVTIEFMTRSQSAQNERCGYLSVFLVPLNVDFNVPGAWMFSMWADGTHYGIAYFWNNDGTTFGSGYPTLGTFSPIQPDVWYKVKMTLAGSLAKFYVDDLFIFEYNISEVIPFPIENFYLYWMTWGQRDLDNISVSTSNIPPVALCQNVTVPSGSTCTPNASIDNVSYDPDGGSITLSQSPAGPYSLGSTSVTLTVTDSKGASSQCTGTVTVVDNTPPTLNCQVPQAIDATGPSGAVAIFTPTVSDNCPGTISVSCTPSSGSIFPIGATSVSCGATDGSGNSGTCGFTVTVRGAATQISNLITLADSFNLPAGISASLDSKLSNVVTLLTAGNTKTACNVINAFINETSAQSGKKITTAEANQLITNALRIKAVAGCP